MDEPRELTVDEAVQHLAEGGLQAFPSETSWGLAVDARSETAVAALRAFKGRDAQQPLSVLIGDAKALGRLAPEAAVAARELAARFWPGPLTLVVPSTPGLAAGVARADGALGLRCSPHPDAIRLAQAAERRGLGPLTATSLNRSGASAVVSRDDAHALCAPDPRAAVLAGGECGRGTASSVLDCTSDPPTLLREGLLSLAELEAAIGPLADGKPARAS